MKNEQNNGISRRSFIKRSTVAAIAATNMLMFTGLVNAGGDASNGYTTDCERKVEEKDGEGEYASRKGFLCSIDNKANDNKLCTVSHESCGTITRNSDENDEGYSNTFSVLISCTGSAWCETLSEDWGKIAK